jgi:DNA-binding MarR family transcriptional regulator
MGSRTAKGNGTAIDRTEALARVAQAFAGFATRSSLPRLRERIAAGTGGGIEPSGYPLLARIEAMGPVRTTDLAERIGFDVSTVSRKLGDLEEAGLVVREPDPVDGRAHLLKVTQQGRSVLVRLREVHRALLDQALATWSAEEISNLADVLSRFTSALADAL